MGFGVPQPDSCYVAQLGRRRKAEVALDPTRLGVVESIGIAKKARALGGVSTAGKAFGTPVVERRRGGGAIRWNARCDEER